MTNKFEQMLERLINEDRDGAEELFHEIVVEKSRDIYESLLEDDLEADDSDEDVEEGSYGKKKKKMSDDDMEEGFDLDEFEVEADDDDMDMGGDPADDMLGDVEVDDEDGDMDMDMDDKDDDDEEIEDRVVDLEDALDDLKSEFEKMMSDEDGEEDDMDMDDEKGDMDMDDEEGDDEAEEESYNFEADDEDEDDDNDEEMDEIQQMREYVEKVAGGHGAESKGKGETADNKKSTVAGKNDMGGTAANIAKGGEEKGGEHAGLADINPKDEDMGNVNKPGGKASKSMKAQPKGHGAEKKGKGEEGGLNTKSALGS